MSYGKQGKIINAQTREIIANVIAFMKKEADHKSLIIPLENFRQRAMMAMGISKSTFTRINKVQNKVLSGVREDLTTPSVKTDRSSPISTLPDGEEEIVRRVVNDFYITEKRRPSLPAILSCLHERDLFKGSMSSLRRLMIKMGFRWAQTQDNRKALMESLDIRRQRVMYLKAMAKYLEEGRAVIYIDETYCHSSHCRAKDWTDGNDRGLKRPIGKGRRLIIAHAGGDCGFVPNALLIFTSGGKSGDYHNDMNWDNFSRWITSQLIPNLPSRSVVVVDNASYHNVRSVKQPTSGSLKREMIEWLVKEDISNLKS